MRLKSFVALSALAVVMSGGCGGGSQWEITVENKGKSPCSVYVTRNYSSGGSQGSGEAQVEDLEAGEKSVLLVGEFAQTIRSVKVVRGGDEQLIETTAEIQPGGRYAIVIPDEGKATAAFE